MKQDEAPDFSGGALLEQLPSERFTRRQSGIQQSLLEGFLREFASHTQEFLELLGRAIDPQVESASGALREFAHFPAALGTALRGEFLQVLLEGLSELHIEAAILRGHIADCSAQARQSRQLSTHRLRLDGYTLHRARH